ncbi:hypothetical protein CHS0354_029449 [Potamilus streckersoni]|uniref:Uncharacterized protein n=1 Tax=Potamilus streckersoni TaxID=2493646 RepID=A0AAE0W0U0_9BIVA|nr:hypothetical protein CHS0354_029449 [Potamilus streckersoni]
MIGGSVTKGLVLTWIKLSNANGAYDQMELRITDKTEDFKDVFAKVMISNDIAPKVFIENIYSRTFVSKDIDGGRKW